MTAAMRRMTPVLAALLLLVVAAGSVARSCNRLRLGSRSFVGAHLPARTPHAAGSSGS